MDFMIDFIQKYNLNRKIRLGIAVPLFGSNNKYVEVTDYPKVVDRIVAFVEKNQSTGISFSFDCGFILCSFTDEQLGKLFRLGTLPISYCLPVIDVGPDLSLWNCFATSKIWNKKLIDFKDLDAVYNFYKKKLKALRSVGSTSSCFRCKHLELGRCSGGCLGHTLKLFKLENRLEQLA